MVDWCYTNVATIFVRSFVNMAQKCWDFLIHSNIFQTIFGKAEFYTHAWTLSILFIHIKIIRVCSLETCLCFTVLIHKYHTIHTVVVVVATTTTSEPLWACFDSRISKELMKCAFQCVYFCISAVAIFSRSSCFVKNSEWTLMVSDVAWTFAIMTFLHGLLIW